MSLYVNCAMSADVNGESTYQVSGSLTHKPGFVGSIDGNEYAHDFYTLAVKSFKGIEIDTIMVALPADGTNELRELNMDVRQKIEAIKSFSQKKCIFEITLHDNVVKAFRSAKERKLPFARVLYSEIISVRDLKNSPKPDGSRTGSEAGRGRGSRTGSGL